MRNSRSLQLGLQDHQKLLNPTPTRQGLILSLQQYITWQRLVGLGLNFSLHKFVYCMRSIITRGLYILNPLLWPYVELVFKRVL